MTTVTIPVTSYSARSVKPDHKYGATETLPLKSGTHYALLRFSLDRVPTDAVITSALLRVYAQRTMSGVSDMAVKDVTSDWNASVTFAKLPTVGATAGSAAATAPVAGQLYEFDVTAWAPARNRRGLRLETTAAVLKYLVGSAADNLKPVLVVTYTVPPEQPGSLMPDGGAVSVTRPTLTYAGQDDLTAHRVQMSSDGTVPGIVWDSDTRPTGTPVMSLTDLTLATTARTNLCTNPSFETNTTGWSNTATGWTASTIASSADRFHGSRGSKSLKVTFLATGAAAGAAYNLTGLVVGDVVTASAWVWVPAGSPAVRLNVVFGPGTIGSPSALNDQWERIFVTFTATATSHVVGVRNQTAYTTGQVFYADEVLIEKSGSVGDYFDGGYTDALNWDYAWTGTADSSTSTAAYSNPPALAAGGAIYWRVMTTGAGGTSAWSEWAQYSYQPLPALAITNPGATTDDGSPTLQWTFTGQQAWRATFDEVSPVDSNRETEVDRTGWADSVAQNWTPSQGVRVPGGRGRFTLQVRDAVAPRVAAANAPTYAEASVTFDTTLTGAGSAVDSLALSFEEPVPVLSGARALGIPDEVALVRDGKAVPLWDPVDGEYYENWAPAANFFSGTNFTLRDYTAGLRRAHTWSVRVRVGGVVSASGPEASGAPSTESVWLVHPATGDSVEINGLNDIPVVDQQVDEAAAVHVPVHGNLVVEPLRRRLVRTTLYGSASGVVDAAGADTLDSWALGPSSRRYRLVFGRVNWPVVIGDYSPGETFYSDDCEADRVVVTFNWWQRLRDE